MVLRSCVLQAHGVQQCAGGAALHCTSYSLCWYCYYGKAAGWLHLNVCGVQCVVSWCAVLLSPLRGKHWHDQSSNGCDACICAWSSSAANSCKELYTCARHSLLHMSSDAGSCMSCNCMLAGPPNDLWGAPALHVACPRQLLGPTRTRMVHSYLYSHLSCWGAAGSMRAGLQGHMDVLTASKCITGMLLSCLFAMHMCCTCCCVSGCHVQHATRAPHLLLHMWHT